MEVRIMEMLPKWKIRNTMLAMLENSETKKRSHLQITNILRNTSLNKIKGFLYKKCVPHTKLTFFRELTKHYMNFLGILTLLKVPYPLDIEEPEDYEPVCVHAEWGNRQGEDQAVNAIPTSVSSLFAQ